MKSHSDDDDYEVFLHPMAKWRLWSDFENGKLVGGNIRTVRLFGVIAGFILLIACINYMNLSTARSLKRAREVGIRKVAGAGKRSLVLQFLCESIVVAVVAGILALLMVMPSLGYFNKLTDKELTLPFNDAGFWIKFLAFILFTGLLAGSYPAFYLSAFRPIAVLKGTFKGINTLLTPRKVMVVLQFTFAITLIICTVVIRQQIIYGQNRDAGFDPRHLAFVFIKGDMQKNFASISQELKSSGAVTSITRTNSPLTQVWNSDNTYQWSGKDPQAANVGFTLFHTDRDFVLTTGLKLITGRDINAEKFTTDSTAVLLSASAVKLMGLADPVGQTLTSGEGTWHVVGVFKDFVPGTPFESSNPIIVQGPGEHHWFGTMTFRMNEHRSASQNLDAIESILKKYNPDYPFEYYFADESYAIQFEHEKRTGILAGIFAGLTIFISCLGLFALAAYMAESRTKEIGVRKVLGASVTAISALLSKDFLKLVVISFLIASPLAWWAMHNWLQGYSYRVHMSAWIFVLTGLSSVLIALMTVSFQAIRAAVANPVRSLRSE